MYRRFDGPFAPDFSTYSKQDAWSLLSFPVSVTPFIATLIEKNSSAAWAFSVKETWVKQTKTHESKVGYFMLNLVIEKIIVIDFISFNAFAHLPLNFHPLCWPLPLIHLYTLAACSGWLSICFASRVGFPSSRVDKFHKFRTIAPIVTFIHAE